MCVCHSLCFCLLLMKLKPTLTLAVYKTQTVPDPTVILSNVHGFLSQLCHRPVDSVWSDCSIVCVFMGLGLYSDGGDYVCKTFYLSGLEFE